MRIIIDENKCIGCRKCVSICPGNLIKINEMDKAYIKYKKDCWACSSCIKECNSEAIALYLGADIGGRGSKLTVKNDKDFMYWKIEKSNKEVYIIEVDKTSSNQY